MEIWKALKRPWPKSVSISEISSVDNLEITRNYIRMSLAHLKNQREYYLDTVNGDILNDHLMSIGHGLEFLEYFLGVSRNEDLEERIRHVVANVKQELDLLTCKQKDQQTRITDLDQSYAALRGEMRNVVIKPGTDWECDVLFPKIFSVMSVFRKVNDFLIEKMAKLLTSDCKVSQISPIMKELKDIRKMLSSLKPLFAYVAGIHCPSLKDEEKNPLVTLTAFLDKATYLMYLSFVGKMDEDLLKKDLSKLIGETDIREIYLMTLNADFSGDLSHESDHFQFHNLMRLLESNSPCLNDANFNLYEELINIRTFLSGLKEHLLLKKHHYFQESFEAILAQTVSIMCLYYDEHISEDMRRELNSALSDIFEQTKHNKLIHYPRTNGLGFLEFFSGYLKELESRWGIPTNLKNVIAALHVEVYSMISFLKGSTQEKQNEALLISVVQLAYQAEYVIDLSVGRVPMNRSSHISYLYNVVEQLKPIREEVQALSDKNLSTQDVDLMANGCQVLGMPTPGNNNDLVVGIQKEVTIIMGYLLGGEKELDVISVVGMPGIGKTTLALSLYKSTQIVHHFDIIAWCTVSQSYQKRDLLLTILDQVNHLDDSIKHLDDQELVDHLCRSLKQRRYLIILDDIWDTVAWNYLKRYLSDDMQGSRVLVTTRYQAVALEIKSKVHELRQLTKEESWELLQKKLTSTGSFSESLLHIGNEIAENCKGLPLSIVIIAGLLTDVERTEKKWHQIAESVTSLVLDDPQGKCREILELSYNHLPHHLRACFLYFGAFLEDQEISVTHLMRLWIVEGFVRDIESKSAEEVAEKYVEDLIVRSLVIPAKERPQGGVKTCRLHDLLRDFCFDKSKEEHFLTILDKRNYGQPLHDPRRLVINYSEGRSSNHLQSGMSGIETSYHSVRSIISFDGLDGFGIVRAIEYKDLVLLKVLEIGGSCYSSLSNISSLVHLRYLAIWGLFWKTTRLLSSVSRLRNLQFLILKSERESVVDLPDSICDLVKLRHIHIRPQVTFHVRKSRLQNSPYLLKNLRSLSKPCLSYDDSEWLRKLPGLRKLSCVFFHSWDDSLKHYRFPLLDFCSQLTSLKVKNGVHRHQAEKCKLHLPGSLKKLTLSDLYLDSEAISEIGRTLPVIEVLKLYNCGLETATFTWSVDDEEFSKLKFLKLKNLAFCEWNISSENSFPHLEQLWLENCQFLDEIPLDFGYVTKLRLMSVTECTPSVDHSAREIEKIQHDEQNTELVVHIFPRKPKEYSRFVDRTLEYSSNEHTSHSADESLLF